MRDNGRGKEPDVTNDHPPRAAAGEAPAPGGKTLVLWDGQ